MPDIIDLISSTPPAPAAGKPAPSAPAPPALSSSPPHFSATNTSTRAAPRPPPQFTFSDDIDVFSFPSASAHHESHDNNPSKRRRFSDELDLTAPAPTHRRSRSKSPNRNLSPNTKSNPFQFSDDLTIPSSIGRRSRSRSKSPKLAKKSNPFTFSDDFEEFGLPPVPTPGPLGGSGSTKNKDKGKGWAAEESDPIVFTSPAPGESASKPRGGVGTETVVQRRANTVTIDSDGDDIGKGKGKGGRRDEIEDFNDQLFSRMSDMDELMEIAVRPKSNAPVFSNRTASLLASLTEKSSSTDMGATKKTMTDRSRKTKVTTIEEDVDVPPQPKRKTTTKSIISDKEAKAREREATKAQREHERQVEKERKAKAKEEKAKEKQLAADLAQVNKSKVDKKDSTPEMIVDFDQSLEGSSVGNQAVEFMKRLGVEYTFSSEDIRGLVKWRRKVKATFNEALGYWEPCPLHIEPERHVLCLLTAQEFVDMVTAPEDSPNTLERHVLKLKQTHPNCKPIYLIEGLTALMRKNQNARNRAYQAEVRRQFADQPSSTSSSSSSLSRRKNQPEITPIDDDTVEDALLNLQVTHACLIHHTSAVAESAEWLKTFTEHISTIPYRLELMQGNDSAFCMDVGQVKTGEDKRDTFVKMLQEVNRVTASMAYGVVKRYPSVVDLVEGLKNGGPGLLEDVKKSANKNGALTDSRIGPAVSRRLYKVFMGLDPSSTDI